MPTLMDHHLDPSNNGPSTASPSDATAFSGSDSFADAEAVLDQIEFSKATVLARSGQLNEAENAISGHSKRSGLDSKWLDLRARIFAQRGFTGEAEACWKRALALEPESKTYLLALQRLTKVQQNSARTLFTLPYALLVLSAVLVIGLLSALNSRINTLQSETSERLTNVRQQVSGGLTADDIKPIANQQADLQHQLTNLEQDMDTLISAQALLNTPPEIPINIDEVSVTRSGGELVITFQQGLFSSGSRLTDGARKTLSNLGRQLEPYADKVALTIIGHTDDRQLRSDKQYLDNFNLGLARANTVTSYLHNISKLPSSLFTIQSYGENAPPYENDNMENQQRNRTVLIKIARR